MIKFVAALLLIIPPGLAIADPYKLTPAIPVLKMIKDDPILFERVIKCYPSPSLFDIELDFKAGFNRQNGSEYYAENGGWKNNAYAGLMLTVPLYSTKERFRALHEESKRRETLARDIASLNKAISSKIKNADMYQLYKALELRARVRVMDGYTPLDEQIKYIEKAADAYSAYMDAQSQINAAVTNIAAFCTSDKRPAIIKALREHVKKGGSLHAIKDDFKKPDNFKSGR